MSFDNVEGLYAKTQGSVETSIDNIFTLTYFVSKTFDPIITIVAGIYIAMMGYAIISGYIVMTGKEAAVRFSKVALVLILAKFFTSYTGHLYSAVWDVPTSIGDYLASIYSGDGSGKNTFEKQMNTHSIAATEIGKKYTHQHDVNNQGLAIGAWALAMAPVFVINIALILAKIISAVLFLISPVVFIISLIDIQTNYLLAWFKAILLTFLTVIIVFVVGSFVLDVVSEQLTALKDLPYDKDKPPSIVAFAPLGVLSVFGIVIISQATTIASSIIGAAAINTQQATGFMQIAALQGASKGQPTPKATTKPPA